MICIFDTLPFQNGFRHSCRRCNRVFFTDGPRHIVTCLATQPATAEERHEVLVGDLAARLLENCGLTKERFAAAKAFVLRLPPSDLAGCGGCSDRQEWLNRIGQRFQRFLRGTT